MPRHSMPLQHSMPLGRIIISFANPCPTFLGNFLKVQAQLLFHSLEALPDLLEAELVSLLGLPSAQREPSYDGEARITEPWLCSLLAQQSWKVI